MWDDSEEYPANLRLPELWHHDLKSYSERLKNASGDLFTKNADFDLRIHLLRSDTDTSSEETIRIAVNAQKALLVGVTTYPIRTNGPALTDSTHM